MNIDIKTIADAYNLKKSGSRWVGQCPKCGGSKGSDRFQFRDDGGFKCFACGFKGDIITWLRDVEGLSCPDAHEKAGMDCRAGSACKAYGVCRFGDGSGRGRKTERQPKSVAVPPPSGKPQLPEAREKKVMDERWQQWAENMVEAAVLALPGKTGIMTWLASRGIGAKAAKRFRLGWLGKRLDPPRASIGLEPREGKENLWVPSGLVVPSFSPDGKIMRVKVRRPAWEREKFLPELKYYLLEGSDPSPIVLEPESGHAEGAVIVEAELDAMTCAAACQDILAVGLGTVRNGIPDELLARVGSCPVILVALDADGPGGAAIAAWKHAFRQAKAWPVPEGKDPGEYVKEHGGDVSAWLRAGLPPALAPRWQDECLSGGVTPDGGPGEKGQGENEAAEPKPDHYRMPLADGSEVCVTRDEAVWHRLVQEKEVVFSENELLRLRDLAARMGGEERAGAMALLCCVKDVMGGNEAYIRAARVFEKE